jgi:hypothetical protein
MGKMIDDLLVCLAIGGRQVIQCRIGEDHTPAERVVRPVALEYGDVVPRIRLLEQNREVETGWTPTNDRDLQPDLRWPNRFLPRRIAIDDGARTCGLMRALSGSQPGSFSSSTCA